MPRRPTEHDSSVPHWLIPAELQEWIRKVGEDLEWVRIRHMATHYAISIRTRPVKREFSRRAAAAITAPLPRVNAEGV